MSGLAGLRITEIIAQLSVGNMQKVAFGSHCSPPDNSDSPSIPDLLQCNLDGLDHLSCMFEIDLHDLADAFVDLRR